MLTGLPTAGTSIAMADHGTGGEETPAVGFALGMKSSFLYRAYSRMKAAIHMETEIDVKVAAKNAFCSMGQPAAQKSVSSACIQCPCSRQLSIRLAVCRVA